MSNYNDEYYFIVKPDDDRLPFLVPDTHTEDRHFGFEKPTLDSPPLVFRNGWKEENHSQRIISITPDILFSGSDLLVRTHLRDQLLAASIPAMHMHPAVYIDDMDKRHDDYWYLTFSERFDCWDRDASEYDREGRPVKLGGMAFHTVTTYSLDQEAIENRQLQQRLLFKMGGVLPAMVTCHKSLHALFSGDEKSGAELICVAHY